MVLVSYVWAVWEASRVSDKSSKPFKSVYLMIRMYLRDSRNVPGIHLRSLYRVGEKQSSRELHPWTQALAFSLLVDLALQWVTRGQLGIW